MDRDETLVEIVNRLEKATTRLETLIDGNADLGLPGLATEVRKLRDDVDNLQEKTRVSLWQWLGGYVLFVLAFGLTIKEIRDFLELSPIAALLGGGILIGLAALLFVSGLGWMKWR